LNLNKWNRRWNSTIEFKLITNGEKSISNLLRKCPDNQTLAENGIVAGYDNILSRWFPKITISDQIIGSTRYVKLMKFINLIVGLLTNESKTIQGYLCYLAKTAFVLRCVCLVLSWITIFIWSNKFADCLFNTLQKANLYIKLQKIELNTKRGIKLWPN
jgi:hypothetical protein